MKTNSVFNAASSPFSFKPTSTSSATATTGISKVPETVKEENAADEDKVPEPERKTYVALFCILDNNLNKVDKEV